MAPKIKSKKPKTQSCSRRQALPKAKRVTSKISSTNITSAVPETPKKDKTDEECSFTPAEFKALLRSNKHSPNYKLLKQKRFTPGYGYEKKSVPLFTDEELKSFKKTRLPRVKNKIRGIPGYVKNPEIFLELPDVSDNGLSDDDIATLRKLQSKKKRKPGKRGRKKSCGYNGVPMSPDDAMMVDYFSS